MAGARPLILEATQNVLARRLAQQRMGQQRQAQDQAMAQQLMQQGGRMMSGQMQQEAARANLMRQMAHQDAMARQRAAEAMERKQLEVGARGEQAAATHALRRELAGQRAATTERGQDIRAETAAERLRSQEELGAAGLTRRAGEEEGRMTRARMRERGITRRHGERITADKTFAENLRAQTAAVNEALKIYRELVDQREGLLRGKTSSQQRRVMASPDFAQLDQRIRDAFDKHQLALSDLDMLRQERGLEVSKMGDQPAGRPMLRTPPAAREDDEDREWMQATTE